ncbi:MAG: Colanic acid biosynthesis acetyltransferase WcaF [Pseudomonadota bacterium]|jgi:putative colanic acid biosynthesis acetyltransferase WcaF
MNLPNTPREIASTPLTATGVETFEGAASFPLRHRLLRLSWNITWVIFASWTPPPMHRWRVWLVNIFGGRVDKTCAIYSSARIWYPPNLRMDKFAALGPGVECYSLGLIEIGAYAVVSQRAFLCTGTHDIQRSNFQISARPIYLSENCWIAAEAFVGPGVRVGDGAVLAARGAAFRNLDPWTVYQGNPAVPYKSRRQFSRN